MRFTAVDNIPERDKHLTFQWESTSGFILICVEPIIGAYRLQVWYERPDAMYPDILQGTWDSPLERIPAVVESLFKGLEDLPELADQRSVQTRLRIFMYEHYGDIYDGLKARLTDRDLPNYNPHANPWWNDAQDLREQLSTGVYRHHHPLNLDAPDVGDVGDVFKVLEKILVSKTRPTKNLGDEHWLEKAWTDTRAHIDPKRPNTP